MGQYYLQISTTLIAAFMASLGWDMQPKETIYKYNNNKPVYVVEWRWVDSMGLRDIYDTSRVNSISFVEDTNSIQVVMINQNELK